MDQVPSQLLCEVVVRLYRTGSRQAPQIIWGGRTTHTSCCYGNDVARRRYRPRPRGCDATATGRSSNTTATTTTTQRPDRGVVAALALVLHQRSGGHGGRLGIPADSVAARLLALLLVLLLLLLLLLRLRLLLLLLLMLLWVQVVAHSVVATAGATPTLVAAEAVAPRRWAALRVLAAVGGG